MLRALLVAAALSLGVTALVASALAASPSTGEVEEAVSFDDDEEEGDRATVTPVVVLETETRAALAWLPVAVLGLLAVNVAWRRS